MVCFEVVSGLKVNLGKLEVIPVGSVENIEGLASISRCSVVALPTKYLGYLWGHPSRCQVCGMGWLIGFRKGLPGGKKITYLEVLD